MGRLRMCKALLVFVFLLLSGIGVEVAADNPQPWRLSAGNMELGHPVSIDATLDFSDWYRNSRENDNLPQVFVNGLALGDVKLRLVDAGESHFEFILNRTMMSPQMWQSIRTRSEADPLGVRQVHLSFGNKGLINSQLGTQQVEFVLLKRNSILLWSALAFSLLLFFVVLSIKSNILRDGPIAAGATRPPMSLARTQMAIWLFLVMITYVWIWLITDELNTVTPSVLGLMGISAGTYLSAAAIDQNTTAQSPMLRTLNEQVDSLRLSIDELDQQQTDVLESAEVDAVSAARESLQLRKVQLEKTISTLRTSRTKAKGQTSAIMQLLSDDSGVRLHRFQIFAWTIVLGVIFVTKAVSELNMPEFSATLLGVMGISSGTYLGFKFPEVNGDLAE